MKKNDILQELGHVCADNAAESIKKFGNAISFLEEQDLTPIDLAVAIINYFENGAKDNCDNYSDVAASVVKSVIDNDTIKDLIQQESHVDVGIALMGAGMKLMVLETSLPELLIKKMDDNSLSIKDLEIIAKAHICINDEETSKLLDAYVENKIEDGCDCANCDSKGCSGRKESKVTDCNKEEAIKLIEQGRMSAVTVKLLIDSKVIELKDLVNGLSEKRFYEVMKDLYRVKESIHEAAKDTVADVKENISTISEDIKKAISSGNLSKLKELSQKVSEDDKTTEVMNEISRDESKCSEEEKVIRRKIDAGTITDDEIVEAVSNYKLNPFYLTGCGKLSEERVDKIAIRLAAIVIPRILKGEF